MSWLPLRRVDIARRTWFRVFDRYDAACSRVLEAMTDRVGDVVMEGRTEPVPGSLEDLYVRHAGAAVRLAFLLTGDPELAQDLAQDAFVRVAGRFRELRRPDAFEAYLRRAVVNLCASHYRRARVARAYLERQRRVPEPAIDLPDVGTRDHLRTVLRELPVRQRAAVVLRYYEDLPEQQVADTLGCSVPAARSLVARAMETLRDQIRGEA